MHELKIIEIELTFVYELYRGVQASLLFNGEKLRYVEIKAQIFLIWFLILIYGWWPWQVLSISNRLHASAKLHEAVGAQQLWCREHGLGVLPLQSRAGRLGIKCPLQGWHSELVAEDNYCSGPHVFLFFCSAQNAQRKVLSRGKLLEYETLLFCLLSSGLLLKGTLCQLLLSNKGTAGSQLCRNQRNQAGGNWALPMAFKEEEGRESSSFLLWAAAALLKPDRLADQSEEQGMARHCNPHVLQS